MQMSSLNDNQFEDLLGILESYKELVKKQKYQIKMLQREVQKLSLRLKNYE